MGGPTRRTSQQPAVAAAAPCPWLSGWSVSLHNTKEEQKATCKFAFLHFFFFSKCASNEASNLVRSSIPPPHHHHQTCSSTSPGTYSLMLKPVTSSTADAGRGTWTLWSYLSCLPLKVHIVPGGNLPLVSKQVGREELEREVGACGHKGLGRETKQTEEILGGGNIPQTLQDKTANDFHLRAVDIVRLSNCKLLLK